MGQVQPSGLNQLVLGAEPVEEYDQLELEEDDRINRGTAPLGVELGDPLAHEAQVERGFQVAIEVILRNEVLEGDGNRFVEAAGLGGTEHKAFPNVSRAA